jgi:aryl-alcohol dehydrogenase-like predicted oxidoreductase
MLILGTVQFGKSYGINNRIGIVEKHEVYKILDFAQENNISFLDTAADYGLAEKIIGDYFEFNKCINFKIITKLRPDSSLSILEKIDLSRKSLQLDCIDVLLFHSFKDYKENRNHFEKIYLKFKGKYFKKVGVSVYTNSEIEDLINDHLIDVIQTPFNLLDGDKLRGETYKKAKKYNKQIFARSVFLQGLFFRDLSLLSDKLIPLKKPLKLLKNIAESNSITLETLALNYSLSKKYIDGVLFGVDSFDQLKSNIISAKQEVNESVYNIIESINIEDATLLNPSIW